MRVPSSIRMKLMFFLAGLTCFYIVMFWVLNHSLLQYYYEYKKKIVLSDTFDQLNAIYKGDPAELAYQFQYMETMQGLTFVVEDNAFNVKYSTAPEFMKGSPSFKPDAAPPIENNSGSGSGDAGPSSVSAGSPDSPGSSPDSGTSSPPPDSPASPGTLDNSPPPENPGNPGTISDSGTPPPPENPGADPINSEQGNPPLPANPGSPGNEANQNDVPPANDAIDSANNSQPGTVPPLSDSSGPGPSPGFAESDQPDQGNPSYAEPDTGWEQGPTEQSSEGIFATNEQGESAPAEQNDRSNSNGSRAVPPPGEKPSNSVLPEGTSAPPSTQNPPPESAPDRIRENAPLLNDTDRIISKSPEPGQSMPSLHLVGKLNNGDYVLISMPMIAITDNAAIASEFFMLIGTFVGLAGLLIIVYSSSRFTRPIREMSLIAESMASLDFSRRFTVTSHDEIGELGESLNSMSDQLCLAIKDLQKANYKLQQDIEKERRLDKTRRDFIASVSHELKTPLTLVHGYAEGLLDNVNRDEDKRFYCEVIMDETLKMSILVRQLLDLAQIESGGVQPEPAVFDLAELVNGLIKKYELQAQQQEITISTSGPEPLMVIADAFMTEQVIGNYINNAFNHVDAKKNMAVCWESHDSHVRVSVINSGLPIPEESLAEIWNGFYKVDSARTRDYGGTGLGLAVVRAIQEAHGNAYGVVNHSEAVEFWMELKLA